MEIGYFLTSEERTPAELVRYAAMAEGLDFPLVQVSDHYHPWIDAQGQSPFVWSVLGAIANATHEIKVGTAVTCPFRVHPAVIAQAAATCASLMPGRFILGLGTGERLNEHIFGDTWPSVDIRQEKLEEAVRVIRLLWEGALTNHRGRYFNVEDARIYTLPVQPAEVYMAASGPKSAELAGRLADGLIGTAPNKDLVDAFRGAGGVGKPAVGQLHVCWGHSESDARRVAHRVWPNSGLKGPLGQELALPSHFEQAVQMVTQETIAQEIICGPDPERHVEGIKQYLNAGFETVSVHQVGPDQEGFLEFYSREILPAFQKEVSHAR